jgi:3-oxoadipate enol-lactonase
MTVVSRPDGAEIWWTSHGVGDPVVLIMGLGYPSDMWFRIIPSLAERYRVLRLDNRGAGRTGDAPGAPYTVETMAGDVLAVLDAAGEASAHVVGVSMGGLVAQELAITVPDRVRSLVLCCTHPGLADAVLNPEAIRFLTDRVSMTAQDAAEASIRFNYAPTTPRSRIEEDWAVRLPLACSAHGYKAQVEGTARWSGLDRLTRVEVPTLLLHGAEDRLVPVANAHRIAQALPTSEVALINGANHLFMTDQPEQSNALLLDWLERQRAV